MRLFSVLFCLLPVSLAAFSEGGGGTISGTIRDLSGAAVSGAAVEVRNPQGRLVYSTASDSTGDYMVPQLPTGNYAIAVKIKGMKPYAHAYLSVGKATVIREDVTLEVDESPTAVLPDDPPPVTTHIRQPSKDFYAEDGELEFTGPTLTLDGKEMQLPQEAVAVKGNIVWIYVPGHGRYLLSLKPHADLGFSLAGQVGGTSLWFKLRDEEIQIDADERIAPGSATYNLYALHESDWLPLKDSDPSITAVGSDSK
jgi:hypothetical protein